MPPRSVLDAGEVMGGQPQAQQVPPLGRVVKSGGLAGVKIRALFSS
jgi:hypothetical protein